MPSRFLLSDSPLPSVRQELQEKILIVPGFFVGVLYLIITLVIWVKDKSDDPPAGPENPVNPRPGPVQGHRSHPPAGTGNGANPGQEAAAVRFHHPQQPRELVQHHHSPPQPVRAVNSGLPIVLFSEETRLRLTGVEEGCVICLSEFKLGEVLTILPKCNHGFHIMCIERWWKDFHTCPTCRTMYL